MMKPENQKKLQEFLSNFEGSVFQVFPDSSDSKVYAQIFQELDIEKFQEINQQGGGIYFTPNSFTGGRKKENLTKLNAVFADLDVAKEDDSTPQHAKNEARRGLIYALKDWMPPNLIIHTKNGIQPIWLILENEDIDEFQLAIKGIIEWSKKHGGMGDKVYDVTRVLRLPQFYHMKSEPYKCTVEVIDTERYPLEMIRKAFPYEEPKEEPKARTVGQKVHNPNFDAIERIDFKEIIIRAFNSVGRTAEFDKQHRLVLDGRLTGTFHGNNGEGRFLASSSHEPFQGNAITAVADILAITKKEAYRWILDEFNIDYKKEEAKQKAEEIEKPKEKKERASHYSWGTALLTETFAPIKSDTYTVVGAASGTGKTTFCINMALSNVELGHRVLYLSLEMSKEEILDHLARKKSGITIKEEIYRQIPERKQKIYDEFKSYLEGLDGFILKGAKGGTEINWDTLVEMMKGEWDLIFIDNLNLITKDAGVSEYEHQNQLSSKFLGYAADNQTPLVVIHHFSKGGAKDGNKSMYSLSGSSKIINDAERIILLERPQFKIDETPSNEDKAKLSVLLEKARSYDKARGMVYFYKGRFYDSYPETGDAYVNWNRA